MTHSIGQLKCQKKNIPTTFLPIMTLTNRSNSYFLDTEHLYFGTKLPNNLWICCWEVQGAHTPSLRQSGINKGAGKPVRRSRLAMVYGSLFVGNFCGPQWSSYQKAPTRNLGVPKIYADFVRKLNFEVTHFFLSASHLRWLKLMFSFCFLNGTFQNNLG